MLAEERRFRIRELLAMQRSVTASELCDILRVTPATIRRDLAWLEREGVLVRSHGGAVSRSPVVTLQSSSDGVGPSNRAEKEAIAREAERLILDGETVFLDASTTVYEVAKRLGHRNRLTVVTNSAPIVCLLQRSPNVMVICTGGDLQKGAFYLSGPWAQHALSEIQVDKAILGASAIDPACGISTATQAEALLKRMILKAAHVSVAVVDHTKFERREFAQVCPVSDIDILVTDSGTDAKHLGLLREAGLELIVADVRSSGDAARSDSGKQRIRGGPRA
ncbi:MAG TPA: DeoR/GlpR family DNA-binding transcription regulator [Candidatus Acidoferrum sp.]|nr:DeoR/GlpR family DNA-binding transcription regulator [Candidatus Acidoferrum sp.]